MILIFGATIPAKAISLASNHRCFDQIHGQSHTVEKVENVENVVNRITKLIQTR